MRELMIGCLIGWAFAYTAREVVHTRTQERLADVETAMVLCDHYAVALDKRCEEDRETFWRAFATCRR